MRSILSITISSFVSLSGLVSCTGQEKSVQENFQLPGPVVITERKSGETNRVAMKDGSGHALFSNGKVHLGDDLDFSKISMTIVSNCKLDNIQFKREVMVKGLSEIPLLNLISEDLWLRSDIEVLNRTRCDFDFKAMNEISSTHNFSFSNLPISHSAAADEIHITPPPSKQNELWNNTSEGIDFSSEKMNVIKIDEPSENLPRDVHLVCDHFHNQIFLAENQSINNIMVDLVSGAATLAFTKNDLRESFRRQTCRIITMSKNEDTGLSTMNFSDIFHIRYPLKYSVTHSIGREFTEMSPKNPKTSFLGNQFVNVSITNFSSTPSAYRLSIGKNNGSPSQPALPRSELNFPSLPFINLTTATPAPPLTSQVRLQLTTIDKNTLFGYQPISVSLAWSIEGGTIQNNNIFTIAPGQTAHIHGTVTSEFNCMYWSFGKNSGFLNDEIILGFNYEMIQPMQIEQFLNFDPIKSELSGETQKIDAIDNPRNSTGRIPAPLSEQLNWPMDAELTLKVRQNKALIEQGCFDGPNSAVIIH